MIKGTRDLKNRIEEALWLPDLSKRRFWVALPMRITRLFYAVGREVAEGHVSLYATSLVYTTLLSLVPLLAIAFSVLKGFGAENQIRPFLNEFLSPLGDGAAEITNRVVGFVDNIQVGVLGAIGVGFLIYGVISMMYKIEVAFNDIWRVPSSRTFFQRVRDYLSVLLIGPLMIFLSVAMTTAVQHSTLLTDWLDIPALTGGLEFVFRFTPYFLFMVAFAALFMMMPNTRVRLGPALAAGFCTGLLWKLLGLGFGAFVVGSTNYALIYSAFATLILFMIWLYIGWLIVLLGAVLCYYLQNPSNQQMSRNMRRLSQRVREKIALQACIEIAQAFYHDKRGLSMPQLAEALRVPQIVLENIIDSLTGAGILTATGRWPVQYMPAVPLEETSVYEMLSRLREADEVGVLVMKNLPASSRVEELMKSADKVLEKQLEGLTLKDLALQGDKK